MSNPQRIGIGRVKMNLNRGDAGTTFPLNVVQMVQETEDSTERPVVSASFTVGIGNFQDTTRMICVDLWSQDSPVYTNFFAVQEWSDFSVVSVSILCAQFP